MTRYGLVCLLAALAWGQAASSRQEATQENPAAKSNAAQPQTPAQEQAAATKAAQVPPDAAVITIKGLCPSSTPAKTGTDDCKTVITRSQFETILDSIQPNLPPRVRRQVATRYANALVLSKRAEELGLDHGPDFDQRMKLQRIQVLAMELNKAMQEKAAQISDQEIQDYYHANADKFVQVDVDRIYVPKVQQQPAEAADTKDKAKDKDKDDKDADAGEKASAAEEQKHKQDSEQTMKNEADKLQARAAAGDNFTQLQEEAFRVAGMKSNATNVSLGKMRRAALPPNHALIMDLKPGQISPVIADQGGYFIYRVKSVDTIPLEQAKEEIKGTLRSQHLQDETRQVQQSATASFDDAYFGPEQPPAQRAPGSRPAGQPGPPSGPN